jgi:hypothetical protein
MKLLTIKRILGLAVLLLISISCASDLDFDQVNTLKLEPVVVTNLAYFDAKASQFVVNGAERNVIFDASTIQIFDGSFFRQRLKKVELFFELQNTINRAYSLNVLFLDNDNQPLHALNLAIPSYTGTENKTTKTDIFEGVQLDLLKRTTNITFEIVMRPGGALTDSSLGSLKLRSSVTAYLVVE